MQPKIGKSHLARKALFRQGVKDGYLTVEDIEQALPPGTLTAAERWLLYYSLRAAEIEIVGDASELFGVEPRSDEEQPGEPR
ncbi:MAG TPA: RNA polymerase sigma factor region1.1 domain-containing protein [Vulgatibacter sp.]|nr:RNA polymerase sigma factor region1.1 domain-containing protein [Vulgatibacter sp.]